MRKIKSLQSPIFVVGVSMGLLCGCKTAPQRKQFDAEFYWGAQSRFTVSVPASNLCHDAEDAGLEISLRRMAVARLFANYIKPGYNSVQIKKAIPSTAWVSECRVDNSNAAGGQVPVYRPRGSSIFSLWLFPDKTGHSDWVIYMVLPNNDSGSPSDREVQQFISGTHSNENFKISEYAIFYPVCRQSAPEELKPMIIERFTSHGVGLIVNCPSP